MAIGNQLKSVLLVLLLGSLTWTSSYANNLETTAEHLVIQNILKNAGVLDLIYQLPDWIEEELQHLEATPVPFDQRELSFVRSDLESGFASGPLKERLMNTLSEQFNLQELEAIYEIFKQPHIKKFNDLQQGAQSDYIRADIRSYKAKLKNTTPRGSRVEMVKTLDSNLFQSQLEADLKVELRKSLLTSVSWVKSAELLEEGTLDKELTSYKERVGEEINRKALIFYLYLFKRTPSTQLNQLVDAFGNPAFNKFMSTCHMVMLTSIKEARQKITENMSLAGN